MREIKFRGRDGDDWYYGSLFVNECGHTAISAPKSFWMKPVNAETVGQFTGMYDCDGREIYEGDVIRSDLLPHMRTTVCNGCVEYRNGAFYVEYIDHTYANLGDLIFYSGTSTTVIGNIHDDPKLMEVAHD